MRTCQVCDRTAPLCYTGRMTLAVHTRPLHIGEIVRQARQSRAAREGESRVASDSLLQSVAELFALLDRRGVGYVLVGGIALLHYVEGRNTEDIDLIVSLAELGKVDEIEIISRDGNFARGLFREVQIDFLLTSNRLFAEVRRKHTTRQPFAEQTIPCATPEGLLLLKLYALPSLYRQGNFARVGLYENDIATLLHAYPTPTELLLTQLSRHVNSTDMAEIRSILTEIEARIRRFADRNRPLQ